VTDYPATFPLDVAAFLAGLDSPHHSPESRRAWVGLFFRDMKAAAHATPTPRWCARYFGSDGTLCATHNRRFADDAASKCADDLAATQEEMP